MLRQVSFLTVFAILIPLFFMSCATAERGTISFTRAIGDYTVEYGEVDDDKNLTLLDRFVVEVMEPGEINAGLSVEYLHSVDKDLFKNEGFVEGVDSDTIDAFVYYGVMWASKNGGFKIPLRLGAFIQSFDLKESGLDDKWQSYGPRLSVEPRFILWDNGKNDLTLFGEGIISYGLTDLKFDDVGLVDHDDTNLTSLGAEVGLRYSFSKACYGGLSYVYRYNDFTESDDHIKPSAQNEFQGFALTIGAKF